MTEHDDPDHRRVPQLVTVKALLDSLEDVPVPFQLHIRIRDFQRYLTEAGY